MGTSNTHQYTAARALQSPHARGQIARAAAAAFETLESRRLMSVDVPVLIVDPPPPGEDLGDIATTAIPSAVASSRRSQKLSALDAEGNLTAEQVRQLLAQAGSQARPGQAVAVVDREGKVLGVYATTGATQETIDKAIVRARTGGYFQSNQNAFSTRTARFIIQDRFPFPIRNTGGGPLYGVQFSSLPGSDILSADQVPGISADPGGLPVFINGVPSGGLGVAGDGSDVAPRADLAAPGQKVFSGREETDFDESVAMAGVNGGAVPAAQRLRAAASKKIVATNVFLPGPALRFPYTVSKEARSQPFRTLDQLVAAGAGTVVVAPVASQPNPYPKVAASVYGVAGELKNTTVPGFGVIPSNDADPDRLTVDDVNTIIADAVETALSLRAAIRLPIGVPAVVHISVVDRDGTVLGVFRMNDGTNFSFDVAVQKARTAAFFSDDTHAISTRAVGFMSQQKFPTGIDNGGTGGPMFHLQNALSLNPGNLGSGPLANGITIFPGGVPLYKNGKLVGGIGISGDGVEQDDQIAFGGAQQFQPPKTIRSDFLSSREIANFITSRVEVMGQTYNIVNADPKIGPVFASTFPAQARKQFDEKFDFRLPYVKFARNPKI